MSHEDFVKYHKYTHATLFTSVPEVAMYVRRYSQYHSLKENIPGLPPPLYDGITEIWFDDVESIGKVFTAKRYLEIVRPDEEKFLSIHDCSFLISTEFLVM